MGSQWGGQATGPCSWGARAVDPVKDWQFQVWSDARARERKLVELQVEESLRFWMKFTAIIALMTIIGLSFCAVDSHVDSKLSIERTRE